MNTIKIINADVEFITPIDGAAILKRLEQCGRVCYKSEAKITDTSAPAFVAGIIKRGHEAVLEHCSFTVKFICDRGVSHEIVRHRMASYCQESTRYCNYGKEDFGSEITVIKPCFMEEGSAAWDIWKDTCRCTEEAYFDLLNFGCTPQEARSVLPNQFEDRSGHDGQYARVAALPEVTLFPRRTPADAGSGPDPSGQSSFHDPGLL